jgi:hypothetical protein
MEPLLAVVAETFEDVALTPDGLTALVSLDSKRGPIMLALPVAELGALADRAQTLRSPASARALEEAI